MIIEVNKEARTERFNNEVDNVLNRLVEAANVGLSRVVYPPIRGERYTSRDLIKAVEKETEGSVKGWIGQSTYDIYFDIKK